jgi:SAM-dependent methyltransferase
MNLLDIISRQCPPAPWSEGDNIPWHDSDFSRRMLREHLSQQHNGASRRFEIIGRHVAWIHEHLLNRQPSRILDLGCGPGLYLQQLALLGHDCMGVDYSPASITYAVAEADRQHQAIQYRQEDMRTAEIGTGFDLVMLIFGELNVFAPSDARCILRKAASSLAEGGRLLLEVHPLAEIQRLGQRPATWYASRAGLFSDAPHLCLQENSWDSATRTTTVRYLVIDAATGSVTRHAQSYQAYTDTEYQQLLAACGLGACAAYSSFGGQADDRPQDLVVLVATKERQESTI